MSVDREQVGLDEVIGLAQRWDMGEQRPEDAVLPSHLIALARAYDARVVELEQAERRADEFHQSMGVYRRLVKQAEREMAEAREDARVERLDRASALDHLRSEERLHRATETQLAKVTQERDEAIHNQGMWMERAEAAEEQLAKVSANRIGDGLDWARDIEQEQKP